MKNSFPETDFYIIFPQSSHFESSHFEFNITDPNDCAQTQVTLGLTVLGFLCKKGSCTDKNFF